ncbi:transcriptional regulator [Staphylococcus ursi]|uniref:transcriptional activator RinB n=1 Tax=Staphylococcus sp. MI 10-1553 TaxID=1912064 RepID=UPI0013990A83|nr:transcriptional regulator [Staphylococcus sp. MI 10-1553]QHW36641.1 transcriptional regulator [Staphylococcus sp. MI 10-1553]
MLNKMLKILFYIAMYELGKYMTEQILIKCISNNDVEALKDFTQNDHIHLNNFKAEVSD